MSHRWKPRIESDTKNESAEQNLLTGHKRVFNDGEFALKDIEVEKKFQYIGSSSARNQIFWHSMLHFS
jgi:hypothetical protein